MLREQPDTEEDNTSIVEAAAKGEMKDVQRILKRHPDRVRFYGSLHTLHVYQAKFGPNIYI